MTTEAQAQSRWTFSTFMLVLATSIPFVVEAVDPTLLSLNLPEITRDLGIPSDLVGFTGSLATLVMAAAVLTFALLKPRPTKKSLPPGKGYIAAGFTEIIGTFKELRRLPLTARYLL